MSWEELANAYKEEGLVLAIGAGVSKASGLPQWDELLQRVVDTLPDGRIDYLPGTASRMVKDLRSAGLSLAAVASVLRAQCVASGGDSREFADLLRRALYRDFEPFGAGKSDRNAWYAKVRRACDDNTTLRAIAAMCAVAARDAQGEVVYHRNTNLHAIVSFNVDTLLRTFVEARYGRPEGHLLVRSVERASKASDPKKISIYYMHGLLRFDERANHPDKEAADRLVFTEQEYFDFFNDPTGEFNYTFLYLLREHRCLFLGLSMQDDNIRRLLHYSRIRRVRAYLDEKRAVAGEAGTKSEDGEPAVRMEAEKKACRHFAVLQRSVSQRHIDAFVEQALAQLGTTALWVDEFSEIPERLGRVYASADSKSVADWHTVFGRTQTQ